VGADFVGDGLNGADCFGHGTKVSGILGGTTYGAAKNVTLKSVRVFNCSGQTSDATVIAAIDWVTANHVKPAVANMSLNTVGYTSKAVDKAVRRSIAAGVTYVVIAGNQNQDASLASPARVVEAITLGATGDDVIGHNPVTDQRAPFSNFGSVLDLFAPGAQIPTDTNSSDTGTTSTDSGTSFSAPHVAGAVAQLLQLDPLACPSTISGTITSNATANRVSDPGTGSPNLLLYVPPAWPTPTLYSLSLNGTSAYVNVVPVGSNGVSLDITGPITLEAWIKLNTNTVTQSIVARYGTTDGGYALKVRDTGKLRLIIQQSGTSSETITSNTIISTGVWHHVAGVFDGSQKRLYIDGVLDKTLSSTYSPATGSSNLFIGASPDGTNLLNGKIDELRVTAGAVYSANFTAQHRLTGVVDTKGLWRFDSQNAKDCADIQNGTLIGGATFSTDVP